MRELNWDNAIEHLARVKQAYHYIGGMPHVNVLPTLTLIIAPLEKRVLAGECTDELYEEIMELEL